MNFRYLTIEDTEINSYVSSRKSYSYICVKSNLKFMFGIGNNFNDYPYIQSTIIKFHRNIKPKTTTYYICKQIESLFTYVPTFGRVYRYIYRPIIEVIRSKYEVIDYSDIDKKQEEIPIKINIPIPSGYAYSSTSGITDASGLYSAYITTNDTT